MRAAIRFLDAWCRAIADAYQRWDDRSFPNGDGI